MLLARFVSGTIVGTRVHRRDMDLLIFGIVSITLLDLPGYGYRYAYAHTDILSGFAILGMHTGIPVMQWYA